MNYSTILSSIKPKADDIAKLILTKDKVMASIINSAKNSEIDVVLAQGGSTAKGTHLNGDFDIDLFVRFKDISKDISNRLELLLADFAIDNNLIIERIHGSRDYFTFSFEGLFFEIVPVKFVENISDVENITDMSPLHVEWIKKHLTPSLQDDIRLAKQFCKSALVYGAESFINGVSGHVLDILVVHYGSFDKWIDAVASWSGVTVIDSNKEHVDVFKSLNQSKLISPLIVIDPVDKSRNAAAAVSQEKYVSLIARCNSFLQKPSKDFFSIPSFNLSSLKNKKRNGESIFVLKVTPQIGKKDVVATRILKVFEFLDRHLQLYDFVVRDANWFYGENECYLYYFVKKEELEETVIRQGPPLNLEEDTLRFKDAHPTAFIQGNNLCAPIKRDFVEPYDCFNHLIAGSFVKERVTSIASYRYD